MSRMIFESTADGYAGRVRLFGIDEAILLVAADPGDADGAPDYRVHLDDEDGPDIGGAGNVSANGPATISRWRSKARFSARRSAWCCSRRIATVMRSDCRGSVRARAMIGPERMSPPFASPSDVGGTYCKP